MADIPLQKMSVNTTGVKIEEENLRNNCRQIDGELTNLISVNEALINKTESSAHSLMEIVISLIEERIKNTSTALVESSYYINEYVTQVYMRSSEAAVAYVAPQKEGK